VDIGENCGVRGAHHLIITAASETPGTTTPPTTPPNPRVGDPAILIHGAVKRYGRKFAVDGISFSVPAGTVCGLVGPNGAGKTTTIAMLLGLIRPTAGGVRVLGINPVTDAFRLKQRVGFVPEQQNIYDWMKVHQAPSFARRLYPTWDDAECKRLVSLFELPEKQRVKTMSRGQVVKLSLAIALAHRPRMLILDEPTSGLDPLVRRNVLSIIQDLIRTRESTVLFSTHILPDVERVADRVIVLNSGRVLADEPLETLRRRFVKASLIFPTPPADSVTIPHALRVEKASREWVVVFPPLGEQRIGEIARNAVATDWLLQPASLDDAFMELFTTTTSTSPAGGGRT
jgi:ABC-2 type transport system ATP-binding protein